MRVYKVCNNKCEIRFFKSILWDRLNIVMLLLFEKKILYKRCIKKELVDVFIAPNPLKFDSYIVWDQLSNSGVWYYSNPQIPNSQNW